VEENAVVVDQPELQGTWAPELLKIVEEERFISLENVVEQMSGSANKEFVLDVAQNEPCIHIHHSPQMIVLQWQSK
jgi:hypothetical protein